jgi:hypothetical protein
MIKSRVAPAPHASGRPLSGIRGSRVQDARPGVRNEQDARGKFAQKFAHAALGALRVRPESRHGYRSGLPAGSVTPHVNPRRATSWWSAGRRLPGAYPDGPSVSSPCPDPVLDRAASFGSVLGRLARLMDVGPRRRDTPSVVGKLCPQPTGSLWASLPTQTSELGTDLLHLGL